MTTYEKIVHQNTVPLNVIDVFYERNNTDLIGFSSKHWHRSLEILIPILGDLDINLLDRIDHVSAGDIYIVNSKDIHHVFSSNDIYKGYVIQISYDFLKQCHHNIDQVSFVQITDDIIRKDILSCIYSIINGYEQESGYNSLKVTSNLFMLMYILLNKQSVVNDYNRVNNDTITSKVVVDIINYIDLNYSSNLTVTNIAAVLHFSYGYICKLFKDQTGLTIKQYITMIRLNHSYQDLINTNYSIIQIALRNGFPNIKSFDTSFKLQYHISANQYRKKIIK